MYLLSGFADGSGANPDGDKDRCHQYVLNDKYSLIHKTTDSNNSSNIGEGDGRGGPDPTPVLNEKWE